MCSTPASARLAWTSTAAIGHINKPFTARLYSPPVGHSGDAPRFCTSSETRPLDLRLSTLEDRKIEGRLSRVDLSICRSVESRKSKVDPRRRLPTTDSRGSKD